MNYPALITRELSETGISGSAYRFQGSVSRVFAANVLLYLVKGSASCSCSTGNFTMKEGDILFLCEGEPLQLETAASYGLLFSIPSASLEDRQKDIQCNSASAPDSSAFQALRELLNSVLKTQPSGGTYYHRKLQALWHQCIYQLLSEFYFPQARLMEKNRNFQQLPPKGKREQEFMEILDILEKNYRNAPRLKDLAEMYHYTSSYLSKLFLKYTGMLFSDYLTELRLKKALVLLLQTNLEIGAISDKTGFPSPRAFQQAFQKKYKLRPSKYRSDFCNMPVAQPLEQIRDNLRNLMQEGILDIAFSEGSQRFDSLTAQQPVSRLHLRGFHLQQTQPVSLDRKNKILNIYRAKDLLLDTVQEQIRTLQKEIGYEYLNCHGFLADDMQIYFEDTLHLYSSPNRLQYSFSLYEKIFRFVQGSGLKFIIQLGYTPSFLAQSWSLHDIHSGSSASMPRSMEEWNDYIFRLFSFLKKHFGSWLNQCPVLLWQTPDVQIQAFSSIQKEDYFCLYQNTWETIKSILPDIPIASPTITCSQSGLAFARDFLSYCSASGCVPDIVCLIHIAASLEQRRFHIHSMECRSFASEIQAQLHALKIKTPPSLWLLEYYHTFGTNPICDSMAGAMLPLTFTLENQQLFDCFGYWSASDFTTETVYGTKQFSGGRGIFSMTGGKKPLFYALQFLSWLGEECLGMGSGFVITKKEKSLQILLYYDIPQEEWVESFTGENALDFYRMYLDRSVSLDISGLPGDSVILKEHFLNYEAGSGYEDWLKSGGPLLEEEGMPEEVYTSSPRLFAARQDLSEGMLHYKCVMKPFEIRFVTVLPVKSL